MSNERDESGIHVPRISRGSLLMLWLAVLVYVDTETSQLVQGEVMILFQSLLLVGVTMLVTLYSEPQEED